MGRGTKVRLRRRFPDRSSPPYPTVVEVIRSEEGRLGAQRTDAAAAEEEVGENVGNRHAWLRTRIQNIQTTPTDLRKDGPTCKDNACAVKANRALMVLSKRLHG